MNKKSFRLLLSLALGCLVIISLWSLSAAQGRGQRLPTKEERESHNAKVREARLQRLRKAIAERGPLVIHSNPYIPPAKIESLARTADLVLQGTVSALSPNYEYLGRAYFDVTIRVERILRSRVTNIPGGTITFAKFGGTLTFPEGTATWIEAGSIPFVVGERYILFFGQHDSGAWGLMEPYGRVKIEDSKVVPQANTQEIYRGIDIEEFVRLVQQY